MASYQNLDNLANQQKIQGNTQRPPPPHACFEFEFSIDFAVKKRKKRKKNRGVGSSSQRGLGLVLGTRSYLALLALSKDCLFPQALFCTKAKGKPQHLPTYISYKSILFVMIMSHLNCKYRHDQKRETVTLVLRFLYMSVFTVTRQRRQITTKRIDFPYFTIRQW